MKTSENGGLLTCLHLLSTLICHVLQIHFRLMSMCCSCSTVSISSMGSSQRSEASVEPHMVRHESLPLAWNET